jgi:hypothetical protein
MEELRPDEGKTTRSRRLLNGNTSLRLPTTSDFRRNALRQSVNRQIMALPDPGIRGISVEREAMALDYEQEIATYLTLDGHVFIAPQYNIAFDRDLNEGGSCPDFVALDLKHHEIIVVEVTVAVDLKSLTARIKERQTRWYNSIYRHLMELGIVDDHWKMRFLGFVRKANLSKAKAPFASEADVAFCAIEEATFLWDYWDRRIRDGLPR